MTEHTRGWILTVVQCFCFVVIALSAMSCSEEPTEENSPTAPLPLPGITIRDTTITAIGDSTFKQYIPMDGMTNLVGNAEGYTALSVIEFYPSYFVLRDTVNVVSAKLRLRLSYTLGDAAGPVSFDVYRVTRGWNPSTLRWDSVQTGFYDASTKRGGFSGTISADTSYLTVDLDTTMVREWISSTASASLKYGIILVPLPSSSVRGFMQFYSGDSLSFYPTLEVIATNTSGTTRDTSTYYNGIATFVGDVTLPGDPAILQTQAGVVYRSKLSFDISFIPRGTIINSALLSLDVVPTSMRLTSFTTDTAVAAHVALSTDGLSFESGASAIRPATGTPNTFSGDVSHAVQAWVRGPNYGLVLRVPAPWETSRFDLYGFHGTRSSTAASRPRLKIIYSLGN
ncbi:MAG: Disaggregatase related repeat [Bacteroidetes bacterium]|nr:Disaggregatase related repeat [Bacteroidota bacterium]